MGTQTQSSQLPAGVAAIKAALPHLPLKPGVYLMKNAEGQIIYVGKAKRLRARVASYARADHSASHYFYKVRAMVAQVAEVDFVLTGTEKEAVLLESALIKKHKPRYNVDLRDDKTYPYFRLSLQDQFPRFHMVRRPDFKDGGRYFGPYENVGAARRTLYWLQRIFPLRRCSNHALNSRSRPCLDYETGRCAAPCAQKITPAQYQELVRQVEAFFAGHGQEVAADLERKMRQAAAGEHFEQAASLRDRWQALTRTLERQRVERESEANLDALALAEDDQGVRLAVLRVRQGRIQAGQVKDFSQAALEFPEIMRQALLTLYNADNPPPPLILLSHMPDDPALVVELLGELSPRKVELRLPQRGDKREIMNLALMNASQPRQTRDDAKLGEDLQALLHLPHYPHCIECLDISHLGGRLTVASLAAMKDGQFDKSNYRRYKITTVHDMPDDYAAMAEVVERRLSGDRPLPDLLVVDGGKGQLNIALSVMGKLPAPRRPPVIALAKGREGEPDRVFKPERKNPLNLKAKDPVLLMLMRLRDETHRLAITYHRLLRRKALTKSILEEIPGVGAKKRRALFKAFGSLANIRQAKPEDISQKAGLDRALAQRVYEFLAFLDSDSSGQ